MSEAQAEADPVVVVTEPVEPQYPKIISAEDRLRAENLQYKMQNVQLQLQLLQADIQRAITTRNGLVTDMNALRQEYLTRYNVDLTQVKINDDGTFEPLPGRVG
jgi:hypothetical protein